MYLDRNICILMGNKLDAILGSINNAINGGYNELNDAISASLNSGFDGGYNEL